MGLLEITQIRAVGITAKNQVGKTASILGNVVSARLKNKPHIARAVNFAQIPAQATSLSASTCVGWWIEELTTALSHATAAQHRSPTRRVWHCCSCQVARIILLIIILV